jgi:hypothetical protein
MLPNFTFQQYIDYYNRHGKTIDQMQPPKNPLTEEQLWGKYQKYRKKLERQSHKAKEDLQKYFNNKKQSKEDNRWKELVQKVRRRDKTCLLWKKLPKEIQRELLNDNGSFLLSYVDPAHVFPRSTNPHMKYCEDNVVLLSRLFHSRLDEYKDPLTSEPLDQESHTWWWKTIIGEKWYNKLLELSHKKGGII